MKIGGIRMKKVTFNKATHAEQKYRAKMKKVKTKWVVVGMTFIGALAVGTSTTQASAAEWVANTPEQIATRITSESKSITMIEGDTVWNIGLALNIKDPMTLLYDNGFKNGDQYTLEVGTVISFDGNHVTVTDPQGNVIGDKVVSDTEKVNPDQTIAGQATDKPSKPVDTDDKGYVNAPTNNPTQKPGTPSNKPAPQPEDKPSTPAPQPEDKPSTPDEKPEDKPSTPAPKPEDKPSTPDEKPVTPETPEVTPPTTPDEKPEVPVEPETPVEKPEVPTDLSSLEQQLTDAKAELARLQADLAAKEQALAEGQAAQAKIDEIVDLQSLIEVLFIEITQQEEYVTAATDALAQQNTDLQVVTAELEDLLANPTGEADYTTRVDALTAQKEAITQEVNALQEDVSSYTSTLEGYKTQLEGLQAQQEAKYVELAGVQTVDLNALQVAVDEARQAIEVQEALIAELEAKIAAIKLENAKVESRNVIRTLTYLTQADKDGLFAEVNAQTSIEAIAPITQKAKDLNAQRKFEAELKAAKTSATKIINGLKDLTTDQRNAFLSQVNNAQVIEDVNAIAKTAQAQAATNVLNKVKADAHKQIDGFSYLSTGVRATYKDRVTNATSSTDVSSILAEAKAENAKKEQEQAFKIYQDAIIQDIKMLADLTPEQQTSAVTKAQAATTKAQLDTILKDAKALSTSNKLNGQKYIAKNTINGLQDLTQAEKTGYNNQIDSATSTTAINTIVEAAKKFDASSQALKTAKTNAKATIDTLSELTEAEITSYKTKVDNATSTSAINTIVADAKKANELAPHKETEAVRKQAIASMDANYDKLYPKLHDYDKPTWLLHYMSLGLIEPGDRTYNIISIKFSVAFVYYLAGALNTDPNLWSDEQLYNWNFTLDK